MINIGIVVGINTDSISYENFPNWLIDIPDELFNLSKEKWDSDNYGLGSDMGIAFFLLQKSKLPQYRNRIKVDILTKNDISLKKFNQYNYIIGLYDPYYYSFELNDKSYYTKYNNIIKNTSAIFYQPLELQKFVLNKKKYLTVLKDNNFPVLDTFYIKISDKMNINDLFNKIESICNKWNTNIIITKPQPGGFGIGFKKWNIEKFNKKKFTNYINKIQKLPRIEAPYLLVQNFVPEFERFYEVRTYWLNGKYSHSLGTIIDPSSLGTNGFEKVNYAYPKNEYPSDDIINGMDDIPEILDMKLINKLKRIGKEILKVLPIKDPFIFRIDFGCCLENKNICRDYFINEIEYLPNIFPEYTLNVDVMKKIGNSILQKVLRDT